MKKLYVVLLFVTQIVHAANGMDFNVSERVADTYQDKMAFIHNQGLECLSLQELQRKQAKIQDDHQEYNKFIEAIKEEIAFVKATDKEIDTRLLDLHKNVYVEKKQMFEPEKTTAQIKLAEYRALSPEEKSQLTNILPKYLSEEQDKISKSLNILQSATQAGIEYPRQLDPFEAYWLSIDCSSQFLFETYKSQRIVAMQNLIALEREFWTDKRIEYQAELEYKEEELAAALQIDRLYHEIHGQYLERRAAKVISFFVNKKIIESKNRAMQQRLQLEKKKNDKIAEEERQRLKAEKKARKQKTASLHVLKKLAQGIAQGACGRAQLNFDLIVQARAQAAQEAQKEKEKQDRINLENARKSAPLKIPQNDKHAKHVKIQHELHQILIQNVAYFAQGNKVTTGAQNQKNRNKKNRTGKKDRKQEIAIENDDDAVLNAAEAQAQVEKTSRDIKARCEIMRQKVRENVHNIDNAIIDRAVDLHGTSTGLFQDNVHASQAIVSYLECYLQDYAIADSTRHGELSVVLVRDLHRTIFNVHRDLAQSNPKEERSQLWTAFADKPALRESLASHIALLQDQYKNYGPSFRLEECINKILPAEKAALEKEGALVPRPRDYNEKVTKFNAKDAEIVSQYNNLVKLSRLLDIQAIIATRDDVKNLPSFLKQEDWECLSVKIQKFLDDCNHNDVQTLNFKDISIAMLYRINEAFYTERGITFRNSKFHIFATTVASYIKDIVCSQGCDIEHASDQQRVFEYYCNKYDCDEFHWRRSSCVEDADTIYGLADLARMHCYVLGRMIEYKNTHAATGDKNLPEQKIVSEGLHQSTASNSTIDPVVMAQISSEVVGITSDLTNLLESSATMNLYEMYKVSQRAHELRDLLEKTLPATPFQAYFQNDLDLKRKFIRRVADMHSKCKNYESMEKCKQNRDEAKKSGSELLAQENNEKLTEHLLFIILKQLQGVIMGDPQLKNAIVNNPHEKA